MTADAFVPDYVTPQPGEADSLDNIFAALAAATEALNTETDLHLAMNEDAPAAALLFDRIQQTRKALQEVEASVEATAAQRMTARKMAIPGYIIEKKGGTKNHKWADADVAWAALQPLAMDSTGTLDDSALDLIGKVRDRILECAAVDYWRIDPLKAVGVDPYKYRTSERGRYTIRVTKNEDLKP